MRLALILCVLAGGCGRPGVGNTPSEEQRRFLLCAAKCLTSSEAEIENYGSRPGQGSWRSISKLIDHELEVMPALLDQKFLDIRKKLKELSIAFVNVDAPIALYIAKSAVNKSDINSNDETLQSDIRQRLETCLSIIKSIDDECNDVYHKFNEIKTSL